MSRERYEVREGDKIWPIIQIVRNTWYDDLTPERVQEVVALIDSWRLTDAEGKRINRESPCTRCGGSGFSGRGTGYDDVCGECGGLKYIPLTSSQDKP